MPKSVVKPANTRDCQAIKARRVGDGMNDLQKLHDAKNDALMARLHSELLSLRDCLCGSGPAIEVHARTALSATDAAKTADAGSDIGGVESPTA